jgi:hypothetical protein
MDDGLPKAVHFNRWDSITTAAGQAERLYPPTYNPSENASLVATQKLR